jgi:hypothetical protein
MPQCTGMASAAGRCHTSDGTCHASQLVQAPRPRSRAIVRVPAGALGKRRMNITYVQIGAEVRHAQARRTTRAAHEVGAPLRTEDDEAQVDAAARSAQATHERARRWPSSGSTASWALPANTISDMKTISGSGRPLLPMATPVTRPQAAMPIATCPAISRARRGQIQGVARCGRNGVEVTHALSPQAAWLVRHEALALPGRSPKYGP